MLLSILYPNMIAVLASDSDDENEWTHDAQIPYSDATPNLPVLRQSASTADQQQGAWLGRCR